MRCEKLVESWANQRVTEGLFRAVSDHPEQNINHTELMLTFGKCVKGIQ